jgi:hypothetical protein
MRLLQMMAAAGAEKAFRFTVVTTAPNETFAPPFEITGTYDCNINWGDGSSHHITAWDHADVTHAYATPGTHEIAITGTITGWRFNNLGDKALIYEIKSWGPLRLGNSISYFYGCVNLTITATDILDLTGTTSLQQIFRGCTSLVTVPSINSWDFSLVINIQNGFYGCTSFNQLLTINLPATSYGMLGGATSYDQDLSGCGFTRVNNATNFLQNVTLSVANYNALILSWSPQALSGAYAFHGGNSKYTTGGAVLAARDAWVAKGWTITDGGENVGSELITVAGDRDFSAGQGNWTQPSGNDITFDNISANWNCEPRYSHSGMTRTWLSGWEERLGRGLDNVSLKEVL